MNARLAFSEKSAVLDPAAGCRRGQDFATHGDDDNADHGNAGDRLDDEFPWHRIRRMPRK